MQKIETVNKNKRLFVLPFDHRSGFAQKMLGFPDILTEEQTLKVKDYKHMVYSAIDRAIDFGMPKEESAVLVDEVFGADILKDAKDKGFVTMQTVEKSGQEDLAFEYENWKEHLLDIMPSYAKVLIRYNVKNNNIEQVNKLKELSDFVSKNNIGLLIEPLMQKPDDIEQAVYDRDFRYLDLMAMIKEIQKAGICVDIWKIEGLYEEGQYKKVVASARCLDDNNENDTDNNDNKIKNKDASIIILGRNETKENVIKWIKAGRNVDGVIGFAIGRTIFWSPLIDYRDGKISKDECIESIAKEYFYYYKIFNNKGFLYNILNW